MKKYLIAAAVFVVIGAIIGAVVLFAAQSREKADQTDEAIRVASEKTKRTAELMEQFAQDQGLASADEMFAADCRSRQGTWTNGRCQCASPDSWYGTDETLRECCVSDVQSHEQRKTVCEESGGDYSCRGGCHCPLGTWLSDGRCVGQAVTREEIEGARWRTNELQFKVDSLMEELHVLQSRLCDDPEAHCCETPSGMRILPGYCVVKLGAHGSRSCQSDGTWADCTAAEVCGDGLDNDLDGVTDEGCP
jgi:hypothetical protein